MLLVNGFGGPVPCGRRVIEGLLLAARGERKAATLSEPEIWIWFCHLLILRP